MKIYGFKSVFILYDNYYTTHFIVLQGKNEYLLQKMLEILGIGRFAAAVKLPQKIRRALYLSARLKLIVIYK